MKNVKVSFIGGGNMAYAIAKCILDAKLLKKEDITISDISVDRLEYIKDSLGVNTTTHNDKAIEKSEFIILALKPQHFVKAVPTLSEYIKDKCVISIMAGIEVEQMQNALPQNNHILRTMPNMPALVGEGMTALCKDNNLTLDELNTAKAVFESVGQVCMVEENLIDAVIGISGSGPAYVFMFIEALADGGVLHGLPRDLSYQLACQTLIGSAKAVQEAKIHPAELKDRVASPAGTTIEAIKSLENDGFRSAVINAVDACVKKAKRM